MEEVNNLRTLIVTMLIYPKIMGYKNELLFAKSDRLPWQSFYINVAQSFNFPMTFYVERYI